MAKTLKLVNGRRVIFENALASTGPETPTTYTVTFSAIPATAVFVVNGFSYVNGSTPTFPAGTFNYTVAAAGYQSKSGSFTVVNAPITVSATLEVNAAANAVVTFNSFPTGAAVSINGVVKGNTSTTVELAPGTYTYLYKLANYQDSSGTITVTAGQRLEHSVTLTAAHPAYGTYLGYRCAAPYTKFIRYADGNGGSYEDSGTPNSTDCGYAAGTANVTMNGFVTSGAFTLYNRTTSSTVGTYNAPISLSLPPGNYNAVSAFTNKELQNTEQLFTVAAGGTVSVPLTIKGKVYSYKTLTTGVKTTRSSMAYSIVYLANGNITYYQTGVMYSAGDYYGYVGETQTMYNTSHVTGTIISTGRVTRIVDVQYNTAKTSKGNRDCYTNLEWPYENSMDSARVYADSAIYWGESTITNAHMDVTYEEWDWGTTPGPARPNAAPRLSALYVEPSPKGTNFNYLSESHAMHNVHDSYATTYPIRSTAAAMDPDGNALTYTWKVAETGETGTGSVFNYTVNLGSPSPSVTMKIVTITVTVADPSGATATKTLSHYVSRSPEPVYDEPVY